MEALMAIAALCAIGSSYDSAKVIEKRQLNCQKQLIDCYFQKSSEYFLRDSNGKSLGDNSNYLFQCVSDRKTRQMVD